MRDIITVIFIKNDILVILLRHLSTESSTIGSSHRIHNPRTVSNQGHLQHWGIEKARTHAIAKFPKENHAGRFAIRRRFPHEEISLMDIRIEEEIRFTVSCKRKRTAPGLNAINSFRRRGMAETTRRRSPFCRCDPAFRSRWLLSRRQSG
jgi:hypothetical protein